MSKPKPPTELSADDLDMAVGGADVDGGGKPPHEKGRKFTDATAPAEQKRKADVVGKEEMKKSL